MKKPRLKIIIAIAIIVVLVAIAVSIVVMMNRSNRQIQNTTDVLTQKPAQDPNAVSLNESTLPGDWARDPAYNSSYPGVYLKNNVTGCTVIAYDTMDTAESNSPDVDHFQTTLNNIKAKGYNVAESRFELALATNGDMKNVPAQKLHITGFDRDYYQEYAFVSTSEHFTTIQLNCNKESDLSNAESALKAVTFAQL